MPPFTGRNILIFSDGTGQAGGLLPDGATRGGPDTNIDPDRQLAFYDPGLGSKSAGGEIKIGWLRWIHNVLSSATGLGITQNIIGCYAALLYLWRPGDRIFLFGFSRGAYTVRGLGGVLSLCGIARTMQDGTPLRRDAATLRRIATEATKRVYRHGRGASDDTSPAGAARKERLSMQRRKLGEQFRAKYRSEGPHGSNAIPHFIGVWDTVAAVGLTPPAWFTLKLVGAAVLVAASAAIAWFAEETFDFGFLAWWLIATLGLSAAVVGAYFALRVKFVADLPGYRWWETLHLTNIRMRFFDRSLNPHVRYAPCSCHRRAPRGLRPGAVGQ